MPSIPEQLAQTSSYETPANSNVDHPIDKRLSTDISHLALKNESQKDTITYENKQVAKSSRPTQEKSKKKDQKHQPANDYIIERPKRKSSRKNLKHRQSRHNETQSSSPSKLIQSEYPTPIYAQEYYPTPTFSNQQQYYSNSSAVQPESNKSPYPQQSFSISPFKQQDFSTSSYTPQIFSFPIDSNRPFNGKPLPQTGSYLYHNLQPYSLSNNPNSTTPYWFFTM
ncbi:hypothetical protein I4U23_012736 [Adineta vaga]|nr:hypothetical protein I4U23_012736 [Adineta vaga]